MGLALAAPTKQSTRQAHAFCALESAANELRASRHQRSTMGWALDRMLRRARQDSGDEIIRKRRRGAWLRWWPRRRRWAAKDVAVNKRMGPTARRSSAMAIRSSITANTGGLAAVDMARRSASSLRARAGQAHPFLWTRPVHACRARGSRRGNCSSGASRSHLFAMAAAGHFLPSRANQPGVVRR